MEDYEKKYKEALGWMQSLYNGLHGKTKEEAEHFFPELKESEDEKIRKEIKKDAEAWYKEHYEGSNPQGRSIVIGAYIDGALAWLEKQGEKLPAWSEEDEEIIKEACKIINCYGNIITEQNEANKAYRIADWLKSLKDRVESKQGEQKPNDEDTIQSYSFYSYKGEPDFKVGDWIINPKTGNILQIKNVLLCGNKGNYEFGNNSMPIESVDRYYKRWTIQDAKDGDVLSFNDGHGNDSIELIKSVTDKKIEFWFCLTNGNRYEVFDGIIPYTNFASRESATPATKEQRDFLFQKMKEAGYEWNDEKKELNKIEGESEITELVKDYIKQKPTWSEEDEIFTRDAVAAVEEYYTKGCGQEELVVWLKSLKDRVQPKQ